MTRVHDGMRKPLSASPERSSYAHPPILFAAGLISVGVHAAAAAVLMTHGPVVVDMGTAIAVDFVVEDEGMSSNTKGAPEEPSGRVEKTKPMAVAARTELEVLDIELPVPPPTVDHFVHAATEKPSVEAPPVLTTPATKPPQTVIEAKLEDDAEVTLANKASDKNLVEVAQVEDDRKALPAMAEVLPRHRPTPPPRPVPLKAQAAPAPLPPNIADMVTEEVIPPLVTAVPAASDVPPVANDGAETMAVDQKTAPVPIDHQVASVSSTATPVGENPMPRYPAAALARGIEGRVIVSVEVLADGVVGLIDVVRSSGHRLLDAAAIRAVSRWRFRPATRLGIPIADRVSVPIVFRLKG